MTISTRTTRRIIMSLAGICLVASPVSASEIQVSGDWITLGDVAPVTGDTANKLIAASPLPGQRMPLSADFIEMQARTAGYPLDMPDGETVWVSRMAGVAPTNSAPQPPKSAFSQQASQAESDGLVPMLSTGVSRGDPITMDMITFEEPDPKRRILGMIRSTSLLVDTEATRTIRAGQPLSLRDIKPISVVRKGDPVQLVFETGALRLTVSAKALTDAALGETVRVINLQSNRTMDAIASAPGEARVGTTKL